MLSVVVLFAEENEIGAREIRVKLLRIDKFPRRNIPNASTERMIAAKLQILRASYARGQHKSQKNYNRVKDRRSWANRSHAVNVTSPNS